MANQVKICAGNEVYHRMNYLYQAGRLAATLSVQTKNEPFKRCSSFISNYYTNLMVNIAKKSVMRIDTDIKRNICKGCRNLLIPGETALVRLRKKPFRNVRWTCLKCFTVRIFKTRRDYKVWSEKPEAIIEILEYRNENDEIPDENLQ